MPDQTSFGGANMSFEERSGTFTDKSQLRFLTCGSVDDGKSTLIGRLLYDSGRIFDDQLAALRRESLRRNQDGELDFSLLMDGLLAEREQGITIDVAYRYFATKRRKFIVADTPGHEQYTKNMVTGASNSEVAVVLLDARNGILPQTLRHTAIVSLLGIRHIVLAVNKMDLTGWSYDAYSVIVAEYRRFIKKLGADDLLVTCIPLSAQNGDNVFQASNHTPWYQGPTLIDYLETVTPEEKASRAFRMPVQWVNRPDSSFRGYSGTLTDGGIAVGDDLVVLPSRQKNRVVSVIVSGEERGRAVKGEAVTLTLSREVDISRGDVLADVENPLEVSDQFRVTLVWMGETPLIPERGYLLKLGSQTVPAVVTDIRHKINVETLAPEPAKTLVLNDIGVCNLQTGMPLPFEPYASSRELGGFILIDRVTHGTVGAGMIGHALRRASNLVWHAFEVDQAARARQKGQKPVVLWFTGLSGSGKSTIANLVDKKLFLQGRHAFVLDGDNLRHGLNRDLGFTEEDRVENIRRVAEVARLMLDAGLIVLVSFISPFRKDREFARSLFGAGEFVEVFVDTPLEICERRDPKGLYKKARAGEIPNFTGIGSVYEKPEQPELVMDGVENLPETAAEKVIGFLESGL